MNSRKLKAKRIENGYIQEMLAEKMGITQRTYRMKENGNVQFSNKEMVKLKDILNLTMEDIEEIFF